MCTKGRGQNFAFCAQFSRFCEKCKPEREYLHPFKLTEPESYILANLSVEQWEVVHSGFNLLAVDALQMHGFSLFLQCLSS